MAKKQTRRSVSINRLLFTRAEEEAERDGVTLSHWMAELVVAELGRRGRPFNVKLDHMTRATTARIAETKQTAKTTRRAA